MYIDELTKPISRTDKLITQELNGEMLVYDLDTNKAYSLNQTSNLVWQNCDGRREISEITLILQQKLSKSVNDEIVWLAIEGLKEEGLVEFKTPEKFSRLNRREVIKKVGLSSMIALPFVISLVAPTAADSQSLTSIDACDVRGDGSGIGNDPNKIRNGLACRGNGNCCSNNCCATAGGNTGICQARSFTCGTTPVSNRSHQEIKPRMPRNW